MFSPCCFSVSFVGSPKPRLLGKLMIVFFSEERIRWIEWMKTFQLTPEGFTLSLSLLKWAGYVLMAGYGRGEHFIFVSLEFRSHDRQWFSSTLRSLPDDSLGCPFTIWECDPPCQGDAGLEGGMPKSRIISLGPCSPTWPVKKVEAKTVLWGQNLCACYSPRLAQAELTSVGKKMEFHWV